MIYQDPWQKRDTIFDGGRELDVELMLLDETIIQAKTVSAPWSELENTKGIQAVQWSIQIDSNTDISKWDERIRHVFADDKEDIYLNFPIFFIKHWRKLPKVAHG